MTRTMIVEFPCKVQQIGDNVVAFQASVWDGPLFAQEAIERLAPDLSTAEQDRLADDVATFAYTQAIIRSLTVRPTPLDQRIEQVDMRPGAAKK